MPNAQQGFSQPDLAELAGRQFITAHSSCGDCLAYHALWPYLRLTGRVGGVEADQACLVPLLREVLGTSPRRVLIAGSADTGVTALVHHAAGAMASQHDITVVDRCDTPLAACRQYGAAHGLRVRTVQADLRQLALHEVADVIVGHSILPFLEAGGRHAALCRLHEALAPGGRLVLATRLAASGPSSRAGSARPPGWSAELRKTMALSLAQQGLALPCPPASFEALLQRFSQGPNGAAFAATQTNLEAELNAAGFQVAQWLPSGEGKAFLNQGPVKDHPPQGLVVVTVAKPASAANPPLQ